MLIGKEIVQRARLHTSLSGSIKVYLLGVSLRKVDVISQSYIPVTSVRNIGETGDIYMQSACK